MSPKAEWTHPDSPTNLTPKQSQAVIGIAIAASELPDKTPIAVDALHTLEGQHVLAVAVIATGASRLGQALTTWAPHLREEPELDGQLRQVEGYLCAVSHALAVLGGNAENTFCGVCGGRTAGLSICTAECAAKVQAPA